MVILKELIESGCVVNRHIQVLFREGAIASMEDLEVKNLSFVVPKISAFELESAALND